MRILEVGISANAYKGDLSDTYTLWSSAFQLGLKFNKKKRFNSHFSLAIGNVRGQYFNYFFSEEATPNDNFNTNFVALHYDLQYHLIKTIRWHLYISQGFGLFRFSPRNERGENLEDLLETRASDETYGNVTIILPTSFGLTYFLKNGYGVGTQLSFYRPLTDYIDNISTWGNDTGNDRLMAFKFFVTIPLQKKQQRTYVPLNEVVPERTR
ncbi:MAG: hypothetical protein ACFB0B_04925 [Thermonemataceae bacterium]